MKKLLAVLLAAVVGLGLAQEQVTIGILSPLTGGAAGTGLAQRAGFELALAEINAAGGVLGQPLRIIIEDDRADPATSVAAFEKLMTEDGVEFIAGGFASGATLALVESFRTFQPIVSWIGGASSGIGNDDFEGIEELLGEEEWFFHVHPWDYQNVEATFGFIEDLGVGSVALLHEDGAFGTPGAAGLEAGVEQMGIPVVLREAFTSTLTGGTGDFRATLSKVGAANPDMLYWIGYDSDAQPLSSQLKELGVAPAYVFGAPPGWPTGIEAAPEMECVMGLIGYLPNLPNPEAVAFANAYREMHGAYPDNYMAALAYAQLWSYADAINAAGTTDQAAVIEKLQTMTFRSPMGDWSFKPSVIAKHQGFGSDMWLVFQFQNGVREIVWPADRATAPLAACR
ncbi:MAG TPA: ABC transporter substrate-binding protein [Trueperaceae bacterium]|nr:ABC transporter substrate-binding protein [Trueperaceae bacterium]